MRKKLLINKIIKDKNGRKNRFKSWAITYTKKEKLAEAKRQRIEKNKPYRNMSRKDLIDKIIELKKDIKDISYQLDDLS